MMGCLGRGFYLCMAMGWDPAKLLWAEEAARVAVVNGCRRYNSEGRWGVDVSRGKRAVYYTRAIQTHKRGFTFLNPRRRGTSTTPCTITFNHTHSEIISSHHSINQPTIRIIHTHFLSHPYLPHLLQTSQPAKSPIHTSLPLDATSTFPRSNNNNRNHSTNVPP